MLRTQIQLTERQVASLKRLASERRASMASVIREAVDSLIEDADRQVRVERAIAALGSVSGGGRDVARDHDRYLEDAFET